ncbi:hypothetical protein QCA50_017416 [Cerrena zonata]|uniref:ATP-dependent RNA helicase n=1 Tax=Cerrena zonata TaxID=2478898 RepID=A0AAW0FDC0_9APHY
MNTLVRIGIGLGKGACWYTRPFVGHARYKSSKAGGMKSRRRTVAKEGEPKTFGLGNFSNLKKPSEEMVNSSKEQIKSVESFDELKIFPTVRVSMIKEIKKSYNFKNTYIKNKDELEIKPSPVQIASIKKISRPRDQVPMKHNKPKPSTSGGDIFSELMKENNNKKLKIFTIAAETGSGKTWAYLASVLTPFNGSKTRCLAQALYAIHNDGSEAGYVKRIVIFVNQKKSVHALVETLIDKYGHRPEDIIGVTGENSPEDRLAQIKPFIEPAQLIEEDLDGSKIKVLVTTDLMARGINFNGVKNIILMEIPNSSLDLVHRIGRTGRMRQSGRVFIIIDGKKTWIKGLPRAIKNNMVIA